MSSFASIAERPVIPKQDRPREGATNGTIHQREHQPTPLLDWSFGEIKPGYRPAIPVSPLCLAAIQPKLTINQPGDQYEQEADRVAEQVMRMPDPEGAKPGVRSSSRAAPTVQRRCATCEKQEKLPRKKAGLDASKRTEAPPIVQEALSAPSQPLGMTARRFMEPRFQLDFSRLRIHADELASRSAEAVGAQAYTVGPDIVFAAGRYQPGTDAGRLLLAHELAHVVQQDYGAPRTLRRRPDDQSKKEQEREKLFAEFTDGADLSDKRLQQIKRAMEAFSLHQLHAMRRAGVRFWPGDGLPPGFEDVQPPVMHTPAEYLDIVRVVRVTERASADDIRHELAHAWDHVRTGEVQTLAPLKGKEREKAIKQTPSLLSERRTKRATKEEHGGKVRLTMSEMLKRYRQVPRRELSFDNPSTREGYSKTSEKEFYAEGYSVFHSGNEPNQARLLHFAPELYELLEAEAKEEGLPVPDRSRLEAQIKEQKLPSR